MSFDERSINWDTEMRVRRARVISKEILKALKTDKSLSAMEFGCGTGLISFNLHDKFKSVILVDTSKGMIGVLNSKIQEYKIENMKAYRGDINREAIFTNTFDVIYTSMVLHHILDTEGTLRNLYGLLNKGGYLCIVDLDEEDGSFHREEKDFMGHNGFNQKTLAKLLEKVGFKEVETNIIYRDDKLVGSEKISYSLFLMKGRK